MTEARAAVAGTSGARTGDARTGRSLLRLEVTEGIKRYILANKLRPGDPLPTESDLCAALGASRSSVREAVKTLHALDIVDVRHGHGTYVGRLSLSALVESLAFRGLLGPESDVHVMADLVDVRELFERGMAERIVARLDGDRLDALDALVERMRADAGDRRRRALAGGEVARDVLDAFGSPGGRRPLGARRPGLPAEDPQPCARGEQQRCDEPAEGAGAAGEQDGRCHGHSRWFRCRTRAPRSQPAGRMGSTAGTPRE